MTAPRTPAGLGKGGRQLWRDIVTVHEDVDAAQQVQLLEACRAKDRLDKLDEVLRGDTDTWMELREQYPDTGIVEIRINGALSHANATATQLKQLLAALRLPDGKGKRPQQRGGARGAYGTKGNTGPAKVSSLERARQQQGG